MYCILLYQSVTVFTFTEISRFSVFKRLHITRDTNKLHVRQTFYLAFHRFTPWASRETGAEHKLCLQSSALLYCWSLCGSAIPNQSAFVKERATNIKLLKWSQNEGASQQVDPPRFIIQELFWNLRNSLHKGFISGYEFNSSTLTNTFNTMHVEIVFYHNIRSQSSFPMLFSFKICLT